MMQTLRFYDSVSQRCHGLFVVMAIVWALLCIEPLRAQTISPSPFWKNQIEVPDDNFRVLGSSPGDPDWVKFTILVDDLDTVYFQDSQEYTFHYEFALEELDPFVDLTVQEYARYSLFAAGQRAILGAVIMPPSHVYPPLDTHEYGIQFIRLDPFTKEEIVELFDIVKDSVVAESGGQAFYFPSFEQQEVATDNQAWFESQGVLLGSTARWLRGSTCYAPGWALGHLTYISGSDITSAYQAGRLSPSDILFTDGVPAEVPLVAGIVTLTPSTPNSHAAILCRNYGIPFVHLNQEAQVKRAHALEGREIVMRAFIDREVCDLRLIDVEGVLGQAVRTEILALKRAPQLEIQPTMPYGELAAPTENLEPGDIQYFGGKAANFGLLHRAIPDHTPQALAFSFDLWDSFLDQPHGGVGHTLREEIDRRLVPYRTYPPPEMGALAHELMEIRESLFKDDHVTQFAPELEAAILGVLTDSRYGFDTGRKLRFRSSTNVEDTAQFSGAGLYDSYSGCLLDDLDDDDEGPSACNPAQPKERGVLRAMRKVFASFYNDNAYLERVRHGIKEAAVGMALLVHHSFPDDIEMANGVATLETGYGSSWTINLVTQVGALSVTNPTNGSIPEEVEVYVSGQQVSPRFVQGSNAVLLGNKAMTWPDDYTELSELIASVGTLHKEETGKTVFVLDFEYKKLAPEGRLIVKQVREIPQLDTTPQSVPFLVQDVNQASEYVVYQGEYGDVFANHRLKSRWQFQTQNQWLDPKQLTGSLYADIQFDHVQEAQIQSLTGDPKQWPDYRFTYSDRTTTESWSLGQGQKRRVYQLATGAVGAWVAPSDSAILTLNDLGRAYRSGSGCLELSVAYDQPVGRWSVGDNTYSTTDQETVLLCPVFGSQEGALFQERRFTNPEGVTVTTSFYWPPLPTGPTAGYTAPLARWHKTVIQGVTSEPIVLQGEYSQTYRPGHHNFFEQFLFEPRLEPDMDPQILEELAGKHICRIYYVSHLDGPSSRIMTLGFDDE